MSVSCILLGQTSPQDGEQQQSVNCADIREYLMNENTLSVDAGGTIEIHDGEAQVEYGPYGDSNEVVTSVGPSSGKSLYIEWAIPLSETQTILFYNIGSSTYYIGLYDSTKQAFTQVQSRACTLNTSTASTTVKKVGKNHIVWAALGTYPNICMLTVDDDGTISQYTYKNSSYGGPIYNIQVTSDNTFKVFFGSYIFDFEIDEDDTWNYNITSTGAIINTGAHTTFDMIPAENEEWRIGISSASSGAIYTEILSYSLEGEYQKIGGAKNSVTFDTGTKYWEAMGGDDSNKILLVGRPSGTSVFTLYKSIWNGMSFTTTQIDSNSKITAGSSISITGTPVTGYVITKNDAVSAGGGILAISKTNKEWQMSNLYSGYFGTAPALTFINDTKVRTFLMGGTEFQNTEKIVTGTWEILYNTIGPTVQTVSTHAIALNSASPGETVRCLFSGSTEVDWAVSGWKIDTEGVRGYSPQDGIVAAQPYYWNMDDPDTIATQQDITTTSLDDIATNQLYTDLELSAIEQGQAQTDLEIMILGG